MKKERISDRMVYIDSTFTKRLLFSEEKILNFVLNLKPGQEVPPHQHEDSDLILYVVTGGGELTVDGQSEDVTVGDVIYCKGDEVFSLINNTKENLSCFVVLAPRPTLKGLTSEK
ncbi:cupin domain-containing protein [Wukongibacter baidiensis]|uniref:cupin domain-containing protein n=1 Tax=Wukongibacter baidiensis TaxID=1723361 RepID=UPI003D7FF7BC